MHAAPASSSTPDVLQPGDHFALSHALDPQIGADGSRIAYVRCQADAATDAYASTLWVLDLASGEALCLGAGSAPRWSPDGRWLALLRDDAAGCRQVWLWSPGVDAAPTALTDAGEPASGVAWSPDSRQLAFVRRVPEPARASMPRDPRWAAPGIYSEALVRRVEGIDGELPAGHHQVFVLDLASRALRQVTDGPFDHGGPRTSITKLSVGGQISWSPDGHGLVMALNRTAPPAGPHDPLAALACDVHEIPLRAGQVRQLTRFEGPACHATVSPDGRWIAFVGFRNTRKAFHTNVLHVIDRQGGSARALPHPEGLEVQACVRWTPDSQGLLVCFAERGDGCLARVGLDGRWVTLARDVGGSVGSGYVLWDSAFSVSVAGQIAYLQASRTRPDEVALLGLTAAMTSREAVAPRRLTAQNEALLTQRRLGSVEELWVESSAGGERIQAWLTRPPGFDPARHHPLLLWVHGGPYLAWGPQFALTPQLFAARGYLVLMVNPRGSLGYGEAFIDLIDHAFPGDDFHDLEAAVDAAIALGSVDTTRVYIAGESGGGTLTSWAISRTTRYAAAGVLYPVVDWTSMALTVDRPDYYPWYWLPGPPWQPGMAAHYWQRSPLSRVDQVRTPAIVMCGEKDWRTPVAQAEMYFTALKLCGVDAALVRFPDNNHSLDWHPSHWLELVQHLLRWFERHPAAD